MRVWNQAHFRADVKRERATNAKATSKSSELFHDQGQHSHKHPWMIWRDHFGNWRLHVTQFVNEDGSTPARPTADDEHDLDEQPATDGPANEPSNDHIAFAQQSFSNEPSVPIESPIRNDEHIRNETHSQEDGSHSGTPHNRYSNSTFGGFDFGIPSLVAEQAIQSPLGQRSLASFYGDITSAPTSFPQTLPIPETYQTSQEFRLLRQYRYEIAPWLDIGDPDSCFGITVLLAAKDSESLHNTVLALASRREALLREDDLSMRRSSHYRQMADGTLGSEKSCVSRISTFLLWVGDILASQPQYWKSLAFQDLTMMDSPITDPLQRQMEDAMFWLRLRIGEHWDVKTQRTLQRC